MRDIAALFREYARLDMKRRDGGLTVQEHERWSQTKGVLDSALAQSGRRSPPGTRRSSVRVETRLNCTWSAADDPREAVISNLSTGGVYIRTAHPLPINSAIHLSVDLGRRSSRIEVEGVVVSNNMSPNGDVNFCGMGVRFVHVDPEALEALGSLYSHEMTRVSTARVEDIRRAS